MPDWYVDANRLNRAANYWNCSVFELLERGSAWIEYGFMAASAEDEAHAEIMKRK